MKNLSYLIESELEKAEVVLAAKTITDAIQKMAEQAAKMEANDVLPLNDPIRDHFGPDAATTFAETVTAKVRDMVKYLSDTKNAISDAIAVMQGEMSEVPNNDLASMDDDGGADESSAEIPADLDDDQDDDAADATDANADAAPAPTAGAPEFDLPKFDDGSMKAAGRARKESVESKKTMLEGFNPDRVVAREYAGMIREGMSAFDAAKHINESYGLSVETLIEIVESFRK